MLWPYFSVIVFVGNVIMDHLAIFVIIIMLIVYVVITMLMKVSDDKGFKN